MAATSVMTSHAMKSAVPSRKPMNTSISSMQASAPISTEMLKLSASFACAATNSDSSRRASHTSSGPNTMPISGRTSPASADRCASIPQVRSFSDGAVPGAAVELGPSIRRRESITPPAHPSERHPDARVGAASGLQEAHRVLIVAVEQVGDAPEHCEVLVELVAGGEIDRRVARGIEACNGEIAAAVHPRADREDIDTELPRARRLVLRQQSPPVLRPAQKLLARGLIVRLGVAVVEPQRQAPKRLVGDEALEAVGLGVPDIHVRGLESVRIGRGGDKLGE